MPKKLNIPKLKQIYSCKLNNEYRVVIIYNNKGNIKYLQVQKNRIKIINTQNALLAMRRMMAEANYELQDLFNEEEK